MKQRRFCLGKGGARLGKYRHWELSQTGTQNLKQNFDLHSDNSRPDLDFSLGILI